MTGITYRDAGVDLDAAGPIKETLKRLSGQTHGPDVFSMPGFFAGGIDNPSDSDSLLISSTDSVGTKVRIAVAAGQYKNLGRDIVNHCINDALTTGARPLFFLDYIGIDSADEKRIVPVVEGLRDACKAAGCAIIGGETAFLPGVYSNGDFDLVGFIVGTVRKEDVLRPRETATAGDILIGVPSAGIHTNGASLVRKVFSIDNDPAVLAKAPEGLGRTLGEALLEPHRSYLDPLAPIMSDIRGMAHITGGGIPENLPRTLPENVAARIDRSTWEVPELFRLIQAAGKIEDTEMFRVFNMGVGMILIAAPDKADGVIGAVDGAWKIGELIDAGSADGQRVGIT